MLSQGYDIISTLRSFLIPFHDILSILNRLDRRRIGRRTTDSQFLQTANQTCFRIAGRTLRETLGSDDILHTQYLVQGNRRKKAVFLFLLILVIKTLAVHLKETVESNDLTGSHELLFLAADAYGDRRTLQLGVRHLASDRTFADQFV